MLLMLSANPLSPEPQGPPRLLGLLYVHTYLHAHCMLPETLMHTNSAPHVHTDAHRHMYSCVCTHMHTHAHAHTAPRVRA